MNKGDLVVSCDEFGDNALPGPAVIIRGPYGSIEAVQRRWDGKTTMSKETKVVDVLLNSKIYSKIPIENLRVLK